jgi:two-component system, cell cycle response regulator
MSPLQDEVLERVLDSDQLPTLPAVASKLLTLTSREDTTLTDIANLISKDMALSSKVLRVSNSAFYSFPQQIASINQAVSILGTNAVRSLVLSFSFLSMRGKNTKSRFDFVAFWQRALTGATAAKLILEQIPGADTEEIFISGLLQNIGELIFACTMPERYDQVQDAFEQGAGARNLAEIETEILGAPHYVIGYTVAQHWGFPEQLLLPILYHHDPAGYTGGNAIVEANIKAVYLADILVNIIYSDSPETFHKRFRTEAKELLGLSVLAINTILKQAHTAVSQTADFFGLKMQRVRSISEILQEANIRLSMLNLSYEEMNRELIKSKMALEKLTKELEQKNALLENLANLDGLTEINNHRFFQNFLDAEINRSIRSDRIISILLLDIDHFKHFNDTYGHQTGDFILKELCRVIKSVIREYDLLARYGGEEFVVVLPETDPQAALTCAEKIRSEIASYTFDDGNTTYQVTISIGVACALPSGKDFKKNEFIGLADEALYEAKRNGRNRVQLYSGKKKKKWFSF